MSSVSRVVGRSAAAAALLLGPTVLGANVGAQAVSGEVPAAFDVDAAAVPVLVSASAPSVLPFDVEAGIGYSNAKLNSQPSATATAGPGWVPLVSALPVLGGTGALPGIGARLLPGLLVGLPTVVGLPPLPIDPSLVPVPDVPVLPAPPPPPLECQSSVPGSSGEPVSCGGPSDDILGFRLGAASGTARAQGDPAEVSTMRVDADVRGAGFGPSDASTLLSVSVGSMASSAESYIEDGRVVASVSTAVEDVSILGAIQIPAMKTSISAAVDGTASGAALHGERCTITGARVAGVPVTIDGDGVHLAAEDLPLGPLLGSANALLHATLDQLGVTLKTVANPADPGTADAEAFPGDAVVSDDGTRIAAGLACLEVGYKIPASGTELSLTFGQASVTIQAFSASETPAPAGPDPAGPADGGPTVDADAGLGSWSAAPLPPAVVSTPNAPPAAPDAGLGAPAPSSEVFRQVGATWHIPYTPFALLALAFPLTIWARRIGPLRVPAPVRLRLPA